MEEDACLVAALRAGDEAAARELVGRYGDSMLRVAGSLVGSPALAEDVVQETWLAVLRGIERFEMRSSLRTWVFRILVNKARTMAAWNQRTIVFSELPPGHPAHSPRQEGPEDRAVATESLTVVRETIDRLPAAQSAVIVLRDLHGWSAEEVSDVLRVSRGNQRVLLHRARGQVRASLDDYLSGAA